MNEGKLVASIGTVNRLTVMITEMLNEHTESAVHALNFSGGGHLIEQIKTLGATSVLQGIWNDYCGEKGKKRYVEFVETLSTNDGKDKRYGKNYKRALQSRKRIHAKMEENVNVMDNRVRVLHSPAHDWRNMTIGLMAKVADEN